MPGKTAINWTDDSWGLFRGCSECADECANCYAKELAGTRLRETAAYKGLTVLNANGDPEWTGEVRFVEELLTWPLHRAKSWRIFTNSMSDPFHPHAKREWVDKFFAAMLLGDWHVYQVLTKRAGRMADYLLDPATFARVEAAARAIWAADLGRPTKRRPDGIPFPEERLRWPADHIFLGTSVGSQRSADIFTRQLLRIPKGWTLWWSAEPLIGEIAPRREWFDGSLGNRVAALVVGGESGKKEKIRPMLPAWKDRLEAFAKLLGTPFWYKQPGNWRLLSGYNRSALVNDPAELARRIEEGTVCALDAEGKLLRGPKIAAELLRGECVPLFAYHAQKDDEEFGGELPPLPRGIVPGTKLVRPAV